MSQEIDVQEIILNNQYKERGHKMIAFISQKNGKSFIPKQMVEATGIPWGTVSNFLWREYRKKKLYRRMIGRNSFYKQRENIFSSAVPKGLISDCVWEVLRCGEIIYGKELHKRVRDLVFLKGIKDSISDSAIYKIVSVLFRDGYIDKVGGGRCYEPVGYFIKPEYLDMKRPPIKN